MFQNFNGFILFMIEKFHLETSQASGNHVAKEISAAGGGFISCIKSGVHGHEGSPERHHGEASSRSRFHIPSSAQDTACWTWDYSG